MVVLPRRRVAFAETNAKMWSARKRNYLRDLHWTLYEIIWLIH